MNHQDDGANEIMKACVIVAMLGARMHYAVPRFLQEAGLLDRFYTDNYVGNKPWLEAILRKVPERISPSGLLRLRGRRDHVLPPAKVISFDKLGLWYAWRRWRSPDLHSAQRELEREMGRHFGIKVLRAGFGNSDLLFGFSGASLEMFRGAKAQNIKCVLEQTILPDPSRYRLMLEEIKSWPGWEPRLLSDDLKSTDFAREEQEWRLADGVVAGSEFVKQGLMECGVTPEKIHVVPYGVDTVRFPLVQGREERRSEPLRVLFVGSVGLRKGVPYLLEALAKLGPAKVQARFVGSVALIQSRLQPFCHVASFSGALPRSEMTKMYRWADVFCLPSIVEGSATVIYEALMSGLPVITTPNTGSLVRDHIDGQIVPIRSPEALAVALDRYVNDRSVLRQQAAEATLARERVSLERYKKELVTLIQVLLHE